MSGGGGGGEGDEVGVKGVSGVREVSDVNECDGVIAENRNECTSARSEQHKIINLEWVLHHLAQIIAWEELLHRRCRQTSRQKSK